MARTVEAVTTSSANFLVVRLDIFRSYTIITHHCTISTKTRRTKYLKITITTICGYTKCRTLQLLQIWKSKIENWFRN